MKLKHTKVAILAATLITFGSLAGGANGAVTIFFEQVGDDVRISATGSIAVDPTIVRDTSPSNTFRGYRAAYNNVWTSVYGRPNSSGFLSSVAGSDNPLPGFTGMSSVSATDTTYVTSSIFGFNNDTIFYELSDISGGNINAVSEITWKYDEDFVIIRDKTLDELGASTFDNTVAWVATTTDDEIRLQTGSPVPEPTSAMLFGLGALGIAARRKRTT